MIKEKDELKKKMFSEIFYVYIKTTTTIIISFVYKKKGHYLYANITVPHI